MRRIISSVAVAVLLGGFSGVAAQLPPEVQADAYLLEVEQSIDDGNYDRAWARIQDIQRLQTDHGLDLPEFHFWYAKAADAMNLPEQALESVTEYLTASGREASHYVEALALMNKAQDEIEGRKDSRVASPGQPLPTQPAVDLGPDSLSSQDGCGGASGTRLRGVEHGKVFPGGDGGECDHLSYCRGRPKRTREIQYEARSLGGSLHQ